MRHLFNSIVLLAAEAIGHHHMFVGKYATASPRYTAATRRAMRGKRYPHSNAKQHAKCESRDYMEMTFIGDGIEATVRSAPIICTFDAYERGEPADGGYFA